MYGMPLLLCGKLKNTSTAEVKRALRNDRDVVAQATVGVLWHTPQENKGESTVCDPSGLAS